MARQIEHIPRFCGVCGCCDDTMRAYTCNAVGRALPLSRMVPSRRSERYRRIYALLHARRVSGVWRCPEAILSALRKVLRFSGDASRYALTSARSRFDRPARAVAAAVALSSDGDGDGLVTKKAIALFVDMGFSYGRVGRKDRGGP